MAKIDLKDRKILYELDKDCRQSYRSIGRKVGLSKDVVASRVKKLQENGVLLGFFTVYDYLRLGFTPLRFYIKYQYITPHIKKEIIDHFVNCKYSTVVSSVEGSFDLATVMLVKNVTDIYPFWQETLDKYGDYFEKRVFSIYMGESVYRSGYLVDEKDDSSKTKVIRGILKPGWEKVEHDDLDFNIMKLLSLNARIPTIEIANKLNTTAFTINNRIKKLIDSGIIVEFRTFQDMSKFGYKFFKVDLFLKEHNKIHQITKYIEENPALFAVDYTLGYADLELELFLKNVNQLHQIIEDISTKYPKVVRKYTYFTAVEPHKFLIL